MIPLKIDTLLEGRVVEQDRVEYKEGWNPNEIIHSICAFANDFNNMNGGYYSIADISVLQSDCAALYTQTGSCELS